MSSLLDSGPNTVFRNTLSKARSQSCLVIGAGHEIGVVSVFCTNITGVNISRETLQSIKQYGANLILADGQKLPIKDNCFDLIICKSSLHHLVDLNSSLLGIKRVAVTNACIFLYEPGLLNIIAFFGRKLFPTNIHEPTEKPFIPTNIRKTLQQHFEVTDQKSFFIFIHSLPILEKKLNFSFPTQLLKAFSSIDSLLCKTFLRNLSWIVTFTLKNSRSAEFKKSIL